MSLQDAKRTLGQQKQQQQIKQQNLKTTTNRSNNKSPNNNNNNSNNISTSNNALLTSNPNTASTTTRTLQQQPKLKQQNVKANNQYSTSDSNHNNNIVPNTTATTATTTTSTTDSSSSELPSSESAEPPINEATSNNDTSPTFVLHTRRWFVLACYCLLSLVCGSSWLCFPAVSNILRKYYHINMLAVNLLSIIFGIAIVLLSIPFALFLDRFGLSLTLKLSAAFNVVGAIIKYFGDSPEYGYWFLLCGNTFTAISVAGFLFLPGKIATSWFGEHEIGKATSICVAFDALGAGTGFLHATTMIPNHPHTVVVREGIRSFLLSQLILAVVVFTCVAVFAKDRPKSIPNAAELMLYQREHEQNERKDSFKKQQQQQQQQKQLTKLSVISVESADSELILASISIVNNQNNNFGVDTLKGSIYKLLKNSDFQLIFHMQGIVASIEGLYEILLNEMLIEYYPGKERAIGIVGFVAVILGFTTNIVIGAIVDETGSYKKISFYIFLLTTLLSLVWCLLLEYVASFMAKAVVFCMLMSVSTSYYTIAFAHSAQVTNPISPTATGVLLVLTSQVYDIATSFAGTEILAMFGPTAVNVSVIVIGALATVLTMFVKDKRVPTISLLDS